VIPVIDLSRQHAPLRAELDAAIARVLDREWYILGEEVNAFEAAFAAYCGVRHCVAVANGTEALQLALRALGVGPGDRVATVANAGGYATSAITQAGAIPVYVDVDPIALLMSAQTLASLTAPDVRAVIVTHLYGRMADVDAIAGIARPRGIALIEDCAQAHGARRDGRMAGTLSDVGCYSFYPTKNLGALGDAGALVTDDAALTQRLRQLRTYGWSSKYHCAITGGMNSRMDELQAAVLSAKLPHLDVWNRRRRAIARRYAGAIRNAHIALPPLADDADVVHQYVVRSPARDALRAYLSDAGVATDVHYPVADHLQDAWRAPAAATGLEQTVRACASVLSLPCHPGLDDAEVDTVAAACNQWRGS
jgi:dTDP-4-amino-4,6-dideoxygalactose transaminase